MDEIKLPELPEPFGHIFDGIPHVLRFEHGRVPHLKGLICSNQNVYSADQMREYAERAVREATTQVQVEVRNAALEEAAQAIRQSNLDQKDMFYGRVRALKSSPVSATQEQAMDARNEMDEGDNAWFNDSDMGAR